MASDTSLVFNLIARDRASAVMDRVADKFTASAAAIGAGVGAALGTGIAASLDTSAANAKLAAQLGVGPEEAARLATVSSHVYAQAWGESTAEVNEAIKGVYQQIGDTSGLQGGLEGVTTKVMALAQTFDQDLGGVTKAVGQMIKTGLAKDANEALDILTRGFQSGADKADDLLDTMNEYGVQFKKFGLDGQTATGLLSQGLKAGARDADLVADAIKEFSIRAIDGSKGAADAYKALGLNAGDMMERIGKGGDSAKQALGLVLDKLRGIKDPVDQAAAATGLFGTQAEDLGQALYALDPSKAVDALGNVSGAADDMAKSIGDTPAAALEKFKREAMGKLSEVGGIMVAFAMKHQSVFEPLSYTLLGLAATVMVVRGAMMVYSAVSAVVSAANAVISASAWGVIGNWLRMMGIGLMAYARIAASAVVSAATTSAAWLGSALTSIGTWVLAVVRAGVVAAGQFLLMAARAVAWAAVMAAQWLIAMGPIGWIILGVIALAALIYTYWDQIKAFTVAAWGMIWGSIKGVVDQIWNFFVTWMLGGIIWQHWAEIQQGVSTAWNAIVAWLSQVPGWIYNLFLNWTIAGLIIKHWDAAKAGTIAKAQEMVGWLRGLPGMLSGALGDLGSLLVGKGQALVSGLWRGIQSMGGWLRSTLMSWARNLIPGPIAKALGIASPSKLMADQIGQWIPAGVVVGIEARQGEVDAAMAGLVQAPASGLASAAGQQMAGAGSPLTRPGYGPIPVEVRLVIDAAVESAFATALRKSVRVIGQGSVQNAFGQ
ncbi:phage tail tape measure protein [Streptomyces roseus]|uniref:phage tail tape measure protein n=1 Tax=Streptomyces roseus TaxID=66430 RepID=UPI003824A647